MQTTLEKFTYIYEPYGSVELKDVSVEPYQSERYRVVNGRGGFTGEFDTRYRVTGTVVRAHWGGTFGGVWYGPKEPKYPVDSRQSFDGLNEDHINAKLFRGISC